MHPSNCITYGCLDEISAKLDKWSSGEVVGDPISTSRDITNCGQLLKHMACMEAKPKRLYLSDIPEVRASRGVR